MLGARPGDSESRTIDAILFRAVEEAVLTYTATKEAELAVAKGRSDHLIAALAHDIRTPLNAMALTLTLMEMKLGDRLDAEDREDMASMRAGITAVLDLHEGILDQSRLAAGPRRRPSRRPSRSTWRWRTSSRWCSRWPPTRGLRS